MKVVTGKLFKEMVLCGANTLHNNHPEIDALNVFPVPDGDTGTNMSLTFSAGAKKLREWIQIILEKFQKNYLRDF